MDFTDWMSNKFKAKNIKKIDFIGLKSIHLDQESNKAI